MDYNQVTALTETPVQAESQNAKHPSPDADAQEGRQQTVTSASSCSAISREVRLGIVMYGGVSLAIYIYGVAHELFRAVQGRGVYNLLKALTDSDIVVDVISGTSAGGINGILLAYALCNTRDFSSAATIWRRDGDIRQLLRSPHDSIATSVSLLNSETYYQPQLEDAFRGMGSYAKEEEEDPSAITELDLFVTGTDVDGNVYTQFDDAGHPIDVKDHRTVFLLKHRRGRKEPFNPKWSDARSTSLPDPEITYQALAKLARITSCFPAAFTPVRVEHTSPGDDTADAKLQQWGKIDKDTCFLDGGVLDNKPFTYTTKAIFSRTADRAVARTLFYVEPDPERFTVQQKQASNLNVVQAVLAALIGIPGYESISDDLNLLAEHNSKLDQYKRLINDLQPTYAAAIGNPPSPIISTNLQPTNTELYTRSRLIAISERVVQGLLKTGGRYDLLKRDERELASRLVSEFDRVVLARQSEVARKQLLHGFDVYFRLRRLYRLTYLIYDHLYSGAEPTDPTLAQCYQEAWQACNRQIKLYEIIQAAMEAFVDEAPFDWKTEKSDKLWERVQGGLALLLDEGAAPAKTLPTQYPSGEAAKWLPQHQLSLFNDQLKSLADTITKQVGEKTLDLTAATEKHSLFGLTDSYERQILAVIPNPQDPIRMAYETFEELDAQLFPIEMMAGLHEKDIIETVRISPRDAERGFSRVGFSDKVSGDALYHFGGFFKRSWRSNDILWGRLDGLCQLVETLLKRERLAQLGHNPEFRAAIRQRLTPGSSLDAKTLFPRAGEKTQTTLRQWLADLFAEDKERRQAALTESTFETKLELLIEATQLEVLYEELPNVITDAIAEKATWNRIRVLDEKDLVALFKQTPPKPAPKDQDTKKNEDLPPRTNGETQNPDVTTLLYDASAWSFRSPGGQLDPLVAITAAARITQDILRAFQMPGESPLRPTDTALGRFFVQSYRVGAERLTQDIPTLVLLEILSRGLLVLRNCLLGVFGERARQISRHPLYVVFVAAPLRVFYSSVVLAREAPGWGLGVSLGLAVLCVFALLIGIIWWRALVASSMISFLVFIVAPILVLIVEATIFIIVGSWVERRQRTRS